MTRETAIQILESGSKFPESPHTSDDLDEACRIAVSALCDQRAKIELDRSRWEECDRCKKSCQNCADLRNCCHSMPKDLACWKGIAGRMAYCSWCGRPLTEEAWAELERRMQTVNLPTNDPLTVKELKGMNGEPVWIDNKVGKSKWELVSYSNKFGLCTKNGHGVFAWYDYGKTWLAYRQKPEEVGSNDTV